MTPDQYRREGFRLGIEAAAEACADYPRTAPDETEWTHYDEQIAHSQACIRAIDVDEALAGMPPAPDAVARLVEAAIAEYLLEHPFQTELERMGRKATARGMMVRLGIYEKFKEALAAMEKPQ